jgi:hypothetical protein
LTGTDIGYSVRQQASVTWGNPASNLMSITLTPGVWLVEGQISNNITNPAYYYFWSLSTTSATIDYTRYNLVWLNNVNNAIVPNHMSSVFSTTAASTFVYMVGLIPDGESFIATTVYMTFTRLA